MKITIQVNILMMDLDVGFLQHPMKLIQGKEKIYCKRMKKTENRRLRFVILGVIVNEE